MIGDGDLVVFDWDGTIADSTALIVRAIRLAAADLDLAVPSAECASQVIGLGLHDALGRVVPDLTSERIGEFAARYRDHYQSTEAQVAVFAGMHDLLDALRGRGARLAIATGKTRAGLARALAAAGLADRFAAIRCADQTRPKPHPAMLLELMGELATPKARTLMIGDTTHDLEMAAAAGVAAVAVAYGAHPRADLERAAPGRVFERVADLHRWLMHDERL